MLRMHARPRHGKDQLPLRPLRGLRSRYAFCSCSASLRKMRTQAVSMGRVVVDEIEKFPRGDRCDMFNCRSVKAFPVSHVIRLESFDMIPKLQHD